MGKKLDGDIAKAKDMLKHARNMEEKYATLIQKQINKGGDPQLAQNLEFTMPTAEMSLVEKRLLVAHQFGLCVAHMGCATIATPLVQIYQWRISICTTHSWHFCHGDDLGGTPWAEQYAGWRPRSPHGFSTRRLAPPEGPAVPAAGW
jgi:hypothetical protein